MIQPYALLAALTLAYLLLLTIATILISPKVRAGFQSTASYQHQSTLRLTMQLLGINDYPGAAASAPEMSEFF